MQRAQCTDPGWQTSRGLGSRVWRSGEQTFVGHDGHCPGSRGQPLVRTDEKLATVFMTNTNGIDAQAPTRPGAPGSAVRGRGAHPVALRCERPSSAAIDRRRLLAAAPVANATKATAANAAPASPGRRVRGR